MTPNPSRATVKRITDEIDQREFGMSDLHGNYIEAIEQVYQRQINSLGYQLEMARLALTNAQQRECRDCPQIADANRRLYRQYRRALKVNGWLALGLLASWVGMWMGALWLAW